MISDTEYKGLRLWLNTQAYSKTSGKLWEESQNLRVFSGSMLKPETSKKVLNNLQLNGDRPITRIIVTYWNAYRVFVLPTYAS